MNDLKRKPSFGKVIISNTSSNTFNIGEARLSFTPKEDFYLINFWIKAEDSNPNSPFAPTIEILTKTKVNLLKANAVKLEIPSEEEAGVEWQNNYDTGYYDGMHQNFVDVKIEISKISENLYSVEFSGIPEMYSSAKGNCKLELKDELMMIWD